MPVTPPTDEDLARIANHYGFHLGADDLRSFGALAGGLLVSYDGVERLYEQTRPAPPQRRCQWPADGTNDLGAWYVATEVTARADGPLAGRRVAIKGNIAAPAGLMIVGRHFGDATCLRTARALEAAVGGFPSPPGN